MTAREISRGAMRRRAMQKEPELRGLVALLQRHRPLRTIVEIGGMHGGTLWAWDQVREKPGKLICVDLFVLEGRLRRTRGVEFTHVQADSHTPAALEYVKALLDGAPVDFLFIDGDHSLPGVTKDWRMYSPLVRPGGIVALHDTGMPHENEVAHNVIPLWQRLQPRHDTLQIFDTHAHAHWGGIGVVFM